MGGVGGCGQSRQRKARRVFTYAPADVAGGGGSAAGVVMAFLCFCCCALRRRTDKNKIKKEATRVAYLANAAVVKEHVGVLLLMHFFCVAGRHEHTHADMKTRSKQGTSNLNVAQFTASSRAWIRVPAPLTSTACFRTPRVDTRPEKKSA